jgi:hypothetical protein
LDWLFSAFTTYRSTKTKKEKKRARQKATLQQFLEKTHSDFVCLGNALGNANNQANLILNRLDDGISSVRRRHVQHRRVRLGLANSLEMKLKKNTEICDHMDLGTLNGGRLYLLHRSEYRQTEMCLTGLLWRNTPDHLGPERQCFLYMESPLFSPENRYEMGVHRK